MIIKTQYFVLCPDYEKHGFLSIIKTQGSNLMSHLFQNKISVFICIVVRGDIQDDGVKIQTSGESETICFCIPSETAISCI